MTENSIFEILLGINNNSTENVSYPKLQVEAIDTIAKNVTNIIYESLKQKSSASRIKRDNLLKFITSITETREPHLHLKIEDILKLIKNDFDGDIQLEGLDDLPCLEDRVTQFYEKKNMKCREKIKWINFIKNNDQDKLNFKYKLNTVRKIADFEIKESTIKKLVFNEQNANETRKIINISDKLFREQQIILSYALINVQSDDSRVILEKILHRILSYGKLEEFETDFLRYLWIKETSDDSNIAAILRDNFFFIYEGIVLKHAISILKFHSRFECQDYFNDLAYNKEIVRLRVDCSRQLDILLKLKQVIYELYTFSFCNENILKLVDIIDVTKQ